MFGIKSLLVLYPMRFVLAELIDSQLGVEQTTRDPNVKIPSPSAYLQSAGRLQVDSGTVGRSLKIGYSTRNTKYVYIGHSGQPQKNWTYVNPWSRQALKYSSNNSIIIFCLASDTTTRPTQRGASRDFFDLALSLCTITRAQAVWTSGIGHGTRTS